MVALGLIHAPMKERTIQADLEQKKILSLMLRDILE